MTEPQELIITVRVEDALRSCAGATVHVTPEAISELIVGYEYRHPDHREGDMTLELPAIAWAQFRAKASE